MRGFQAGRLSLSLNGEATGREESGADLTEVAANVAAIYASLRDDIDRGTRTITGFPHAEWMARLVDAAAFVTRGSARASRRLAGRLMSWTCR